MPNVGGRCRWTQPLVNTYTTAMKNGVFNVFADDDHATYVQALTEGTPPR